MYVKALYVVCMLRVHSLEFWNSQTPDALAARRVVVQNLIALNQTVCRHFLQTSTQT